MKEFIPDAKCGYPQKLDNLNPCKRPCKLTQKQGELHNEEKLWQQIQKPGGARSDSREKSIAESPRQYPPEPGGAMEKKLMEASSDVFATRAEKQQQYDESYLLKKIGQLEVENDFLRKKLL